MNYQNKNFKKRWEELSFFEQMANIGSEIERTINWRGKNLKYSKIAFERALELIDLTINDKKNHKRGRLKELLRAREVLIDYFCFDNIYQSTDKSWQNYFLAFNYAANR